MARDRDSRGKMGSRNATTRGVVLNGILGLALLATGCTPGVVGVPEELPPFSGACTRCARWMEGSFVNTDQSRDRGEPEYRLHQVRIWPERTDGIWMYSELDSPASPDRSIQQSVLRLNDDLEGGIVIESYELPGDSGMYRGDWRVPTRFDSVDQFNLEPKGGCSIQLRQDRDGGLSGSGGGDRCASTLPGSTYQSTRITIGPLGLTLWLKGYDSTGKQVFGPGEAGWTMNRVGATRSPVRSGPGGTEDSD